MAGWTDVRIEAAIPSPTVKLTLHPHPAAVHGSVSDTAHRPSAGAPVYLEHNGDIRTARTDVKGAYSFIGLAPGSYRLLSTFEAPAWEGAPVIQVEEGKNLAQDLELLVVR
jgi:protocatechuate 3,4-dioxygenase beta subunit